MAGWLGIIVFILLLVLESCLLPEDVTWIAPVYWIPVACLILIASLMGVLDTARSFESAFSVMSVPTGYSPDKMLCSNFSNTRSESDDIILSPISSTVQSVKSFVKFLELERGNNVVPAVVELTIDPLFYL